MLNSNDDDGFIEIEMFMLRSIISLNICYGHMLRMFIFEMNEWGNGTGRIVRISNYYRDVEGIF